MRVLVVEDDPEDMQIAAFAMEESGDPRFQVVGADSLARGLVQAAEVKPDVALLDLQLPDSNDLDTIRAMREQYPRLPIVVFSGTQDLDVSLAALRLGAQDYIVKGEFTPESLRRSLIYATERAQMQYGAPLGESGESMVEMPAPHPRQAGDLAAPVKTWVAEGKDILYVALDARPVDIAPAMAGIDMDHVHWLDPSPPLYQGETELNHVRLITGMASPEEISMKAERFAGSVKEPVVLIDSLSALAKSLSMKEIGLFVQYMASRMEVHGATLAVVIQEDGRAASLRELVRGARLAAI